MDILYDAVSGGFYSQSFHGAAIPATAKTIPADVHAALLSAQSQGARIVADPDGLPVAQWPDPPTAQDVLDAERAGMNASRFQIKAALHIAGLLSAADLAVENEGGVAKIAWSDAAAFSRSSATISVIAAAIGMTDLQVDDLFRTAAQIEA